jgi:hypothetical protein
VAQAQEEPEYLLGPDPLLATVSKVKVRISDEVKDGCFTNSTAIKTTVELTLRQYGVLVDDEAVDTVWVSALGGRNRTPSGRDLGCGVVAEMELDLRRAVYIPYADGKMAITSVTHWVATSLLNGPDNLDDSVKRFATDASEKLVNRILKGRQEFFSKNPAVKATGYLSATLAYAKEAAPYINPKLAALTVDGNVSLTWEDALEQLD